MISLRSLIALLLFLNLSPVKASSLQLFTENYHPFNYREQNELKGVGVDIVRALQEKTGPVSEPKVLPWKRAYRTVLSHSQHWYFLHHPYQTKRKSVQLGWSSLQCA